MHKRHLITLLACCGLSAATLVFAAAIEATKSPGILASVSASDRPLPAVTNPPAPLSMEGEALGGANGPFFPSSARNSEGRLLDGRLLIDAEGCGRAGCHPDQLAEWRSSPHRYAGLENPWYRKSFEAMRAARGPVASRWCAGCHSPALLQSGQVDRLPLPSAGGPQAGGTAGPPPDPEIVQAGVTCTSCHGIGAVRSTMGQADYELDLPPFHDLAVSRDPALQAIYDNLVRADPEAHRRAYARPVLTTAELCSTCHKSHVDVPINGKAWLREMDDYDPWQISGISGQAARAFNSSPHTRTCVDCHMREVAGAEAAPGASRSHRFAAAHTALPALHGDQEQLAAVERVLKSGRVTIDLFALSAPSGSQPASVIAPLGRFPVQVRRGETRRLTVVLRSRDIGHGFPGGKQDMLDAWVEVKAVDEQGRVVFWSGKGDESSPVDPGAHFLRVRWVNEKGELLLHREVWDVRAVVSQRNLVPDGSEVVHYRFAIAADAGDRITLTARLKYRKFSWEYTDWVFPDASGNSGGQVPRMPVVVMAESTATLEVVDADAPLPAPAEPSAPVPAADVERWHDYGVGLAVQGDWRNAAPVLDLVTRLAPDHPDAWINLTRVVFAEGDLERTRAVLEQVVRREPDSARMHYYTGLLAARQGNTALGLEHLRKAAALYPRDRAMRREVVTLLLTAKEYASAIAELELILQVDPEDRAAHLAMTSAYRALGHNDRAERHQRLADRLAPLETGHILNPQFWTAHPHDNIERQLVHEHTSMPFADLPASPPGGMP